MSTYTNEPIQYHNMHDTIYALDKDIIWRIGCPTGPLYIVPAGFEFDVSIPWWLYWLFSPHEPKYFKAAAIHDHMLEAGWDSLTAGANFHEALKAENVGLFVRIIMWLGVSFWCYQYS
jgi:Protein of unknown function (DUF1353)